MNCALNRSRLLRLLCLCGNKRVNEVLAKDLNKLLALCTGQELLDRLCVSLSDKLHDGRHWKLVAVLKRGQHDLCRVLDHVLRQRKPGSPDRLRKLLVVLLCPEVNSLLVSACLFLLLALLLSTFELLDLALVLAQFLLLRIERKLLKLS